MRLSSLGFPAALATTLSMAAACGGTDDLSSQNASSAGATTTATTTFGTSDTSGAETGGDAGDGDGDATGDGDGTSEPAPVCLVACSVAADCDLGGGAALDEDNYECQGGGCLFIGCNSDSECEMQTPGTVCRAWGDETISNCVKSCTTPDDCSAGVSQAFDADNYECDAGACRYIGCNSDAECSDPIPNQVCSSIGGNLPTCAAGCTIPADCPLPDQYDCEMGACVFHGCENDAECFDGFVCVD